MKKGVVIAICAILFLCAIIACGGGAVWYFFIKQSPSKSYSTATNFLKNGDYYQVSSTGTVSMAISIPNSEKQFSSMTSTGSSKIDIKNKNVYTKSTTITDSQTSNSEMYQINGDTIYSSTDGGDSFQKYTLSEAKAKGISSYDENMQIDSILKSMTTKPKTLSDDTIAGEKQYHYSITLSETDMDKYLKSLTEQLEGSSGQSGITISNVKMDTAQIELWISQKTSRMTKGILTIKSISMDMSVMGETAGLEMTDFKLTDTYSNWGEKVTIQAPL